MFLYIHVLEKIECNKFLINKSLINLLTGLNERTIKKKSNSNK